MARRRTEWLRCGALAALTAGCAPLQPPVITAEASPRATEPAPGWLPAGWVRQTPRPSFAPERDLVQIYSPGLATAPVVVTARYTPAEAAALRARHGDDLAGWLADRLGTLLGQGFRRLDGREPWRRAGAVGGQLLHVHGDEPEDRSPALHGPVAVAGTPSGGLLVVAVLLPPDGDATLPERVLAAVPLD